MDSDEYMDSDDLYTSLIVTVTRLMDVKRAYAEIILNTAKEAAARVMVSERKAVRFEYELKTAKDDAVNMLLRLKQMMDFKISEAAVTSCTQQKKIEELEAQLQEAEDIVKDLREELRAVEAKLDRFSKVKYPVQVNNASTGNIRSTPEPLIFPHSQAVEAELESFSKVKHPLQVNNTSTGNIRSTPEPLIFPHSQAVEAELERFSKVKHPLQLNNASTENMLSTPEPNTFTHSVAKPNSNIDQTNNSHGLYNSFFPFKKSLISNADLPSIISRSKETELYRNGCTQRIRACERSRQDTKLSVSVKPNDINKNPQSIISRDKVSEKVIVLEQVKERDLAADNSCLTLPSSIKHTNDTAIEENSNESKAIVKDRELTNSDELMPSSQVKDDVDPPSRSSETEVSETEVQSNPSTDKVIKFTFQRKRKRGAMTDGSGSSESKQGPMTDESGSGDSNQENQAAHVVPGKVNLIGESTPEKIHLEQVANQLVSLSDKINW